MTACRLQESPEFKKWQATRKGLRARQLAVSGAVLAALLALGTGGILLSRHAGCGPGHRCFVLTSTRWLECAP